MNFGRSEPFTAKRAEGMLWSDPRGKGDGLQQDACIPAELRAVQRQQRRNRERTGQPSHRRDGDDVSVSLVRVCDLGRSPRAAQAPEARGRFFMR